MQVETFYPIDKHLRNHIEYYYFLRSHSSDFKSEYFVFPNILHALNIHHNVEYEIAPRSVKVTGTGTENYTMLLQGRFEIPMQVRLTGNIDKITIIFKPLGLNHFIASPFYKICSQHTQQFTEWHDHRDYYSFLAAFFSEENFTRRIEILEKYLLHHYHAIDNHHLLDQSLNLLCNFDEELSIEEIARKLNLTTRTFNRMFKNNLGISPIGYKKIARFRHSLKNKLFSQQLKRLTEIGYESNFYDQAYFTKMYKKLTNTTPGEFFESITKLADNQLIFKFINQ